MQNKTISTDLESKSNKLEELNLVVKTEKDRNERLKCAIATTKSVKQASKEPKEKDIFHQMKKLLKPPKVQLTTGNIF